MSFNDQVRKMMNFTKTVGDRDVLPAGKREFLPEDTLTRLKGQWNSAGRDAALVYAKLTESDGTSFYVTGWNGQNTYAGFESGKGFGYLPTDRLSKSKLDESWDTEATLGFVRENLSEMEQTEISDMLDTLKKCVTKRSKGRRKSEVKNFIKRFEKLMQKTSEPVKEGEENEVEAEMNKFSKPFDLKRTPLKKRK